MNPNDPTTNCTACQGNVAFNRDGRCPDCQGTGKQEQATTTAGLTAEKRDCTPESGSPSAGNGEEEPQHADQAGRFIERLTHLGEARAALRRFVAEPTSPAENELHDALCCVVTHLEESSDLASAETEGGKPVWLDNI